MEFESPTGERASLVVDAFEPPNARAAAVYMPGFGSVRSGQKARAFARAFSHSGFAFFAFDPRGHGDSSGSLEGLTLDRHLEDLTRVHAVVSRRFPRIVGIGSSLGGLALVTFAALHPRALRFFVGIGTAFGFHERWSRVPIARRPLHLTPEAIRSVRRARTALLAPEFKIPALLWHGMRDETVPWKEAARFAAAAAGDVELRLLGIGDHRLTAWKDRLALESAERARRAIRFGRVP